MKKDIEGDIVLFGAGKYLEDILHFVEMEKVKYICDNDASKHGQELYGKKIIGIEELKKLSICCKIKIVITSKLYGNEIKRQLEKENLVQYVDFVYLIRENILFREKGKAYIGMRYDDTSTKIYGHSYARDTNAYKREYIKGSITDEYNLAVEEDLALPVGIISHVTNIKLDGYNRCFQQEGYHYLRADKGDGELHLKADTKVIVGDPIAMGSKSYKGKIKLLLIIDSLPQTLVEGEQMEVLMPNTKRYFRDGITFTNCYSTADWTLPGVATIHTGLYPKEHRLLHPKAMTVLSKKCITSEFKERGYLTSHFGSCWRGKPEYGYIKDVDRYVYVMGDEKGVAYEMIANTMEHIRAFPNRDHFIILDLYDLHHDQRGIADISMQMQESLEEAFYIDAHTGKSVSKGYDAVKARIHRKKVSRLDFYLRTLYSFLEDYGKEDVSVVLAADHGISFSAPRPEAPMGWDGYSIQINQNMLRVPMLVQDSGLTFQMASHNTDNTVVYPILKRMADGTIGNADLIRLSRKEFVYNESIYPGQKYCLRILQDDLVIDYESKDAVGENCTIPLELGAFRVWNAKSGKEVQDTEILAKYESVIRHHIG